MNILYATDRNYIHVCATSIVSLLENNQEADKIHIYILSDDLGEQEEKLYQLVKKYNRQVTILSTGKLAKWFEKQGVEKFNGGYTTYFRLAAAKLLPELDKILYIDCDTLIEGELKEFYDTDIDGKPGAAVRDALLAESNLSLRRPLHSLYYCAGVMLINLAYWRENDVLEKCLKALSQINLSSTMTAGDQELINYVLGDDIVTVALKYDVTQLLRMYSSRNLLLMIHKNEEDFYSVDEMDAARLHPIILHITGYWWGRPWNEECMDPITKKWESYLEMTPWKDTPKQVYERPWNTKISIHLYNILPQKMYCFLKLYLERFKIWKKRKLK